MSYLRNTFYASLAVFGFSAGFFGFFYGTYENKSPVRSPVDFRIIPAIIREEMPKGKNLELLLVQNTEGKDGIIEKKEETSKEKKSSRDKENSVKEGQPQEKYDENWQQRMRELYGSARV